MVTLDSNNAIQKSQEPVKYFKEKSDDITYETENCICIIYNSREKLSTKTLSREDRILSCKSWVESGSIEI